MKFRFIFLLLAFSLILFGCVHNSKDFKMAKAKGIPAFISLLKTSRPNSAGGIDVYINIVNTSDKPFKYVYYTVAPYNRVGDLQSSEIGNKIYARLEDTGPLRPDLVSRGHWKNIWYNHSVTCIELVSIEIIYMDGDSVIIKGDELPGYMSSSVNNSCSFK